MKKPSPTSVRLLLVVLLAVAVRVWGGTSQGLNMDEVYEVTLAVEPVSEIIHAPDSMPPLYPLLLQGWLTAWGGGDAAARWLSVLFGVAGVIAVWGVGRELLGEATGLAAAFVTALLPLHVFYSQLVRCYALLFFLVALALWLLVRAAGNDRPRDWIGFVLASIAGLYTHYYFVIFLAVSLPVLVLLRWKLWPRGRAFVAYVVIAAAAVPLLWLLPGDVAFQTAIRQPRLLGVASFGYSYLSFFTGYSLGPSRTELQTMDTLAALRAVAPWAAAIAAVLAVLGWAGLRRISWHSEAPALVTLAVLPVLVVGALGYAAGLNYHVRFVLWCMIPVAVWLGAGISSGWRSWPVRLAAVGFVAISAVAINNRHTLDRYANEDLRGAAAHVAAHSEPGEPVFVLSDYFNLSLRHYLGEGFTVVELPAAGEINRAVREAEDVDPARATIAAHAPSGQRYWLVYSRSHDGDPAGLLLESLTEDGAVEEARLPGVVVYHGP